MHGHTLLGDALGSPVTHGEETDIAMSSRYIVFPFNAELLPVIGIRCEECARLKRVY
jgi:hypothetical protein